MVSGRPTSTMGVDAPYVRKPMRSTSVTRSLTMLLLRHPRLLRLSKPVTARLYRGLPTGYPQLMSGGDAAVRNARKPSVRGSKTDG